MKNYYEILQISRSASPEIIEKAYRTLSKKYHPDLQPRDKLYWAECQFKELKEAYDVLSNPLTRRNYDIELTNYYNPQINYASNVNNTTYTEKPNQEPPSLKRKKSKSTSTKQQIDGFVNVSISGLKDLLRSIPTLIKEEKNKPVAERSKDIKALILTLIIVSIIIFVFLKVPFLKNLLFP